MAENPKGDPFADLSLGERAAIARVEASLFGDDAARPPTRVDRYEIIDAVGRGSFGRVYRARDPNLDRVIAIKVLGEANPPADRARMLIREAKIMATVGHPNVAAVYDAGVVGEREDARVFIAMELVDGVSLRGWLDQPRSIADIVDVMRQAGRGLAAAHAAGVIHGDFKPENVLFGGDGRVRVVDFGLGDWSRTPSVGEAGRGEYVRLQAPSSNDRAADDAPPVTSGREREDRDGAPPQPLLTATGGLVGTPAYMAPEQHEGRPADARSDQFAFAVVLFEAITGQRPFGGDTLSELAAEVRSGRRRSPPQARRAPRWLLQIVDRGLSIDPAQRFASMDALLAALERRPARWGVRLAMVGALGAAVAAGALLIGAPDRDRDCNSAAAALGPVWNPQRRAAIESAFAATGLPYAKASWTTASRRIDAYARQWSLARVDACEASLVRGEQTAAIHDRRTACLRERLGALTAAVDLLADADPATVQRAVAIAGSLPALAPCSDLAELGASAPPPADPDKRRAVERLSDDLGRAYALYAAGRWSEALDIARRVATEAAPLGYPPLRAMAQVWIAEALMAQGQDAEAMAAAREAFDLALAGSDHRLTALAATTLAFGGARDPRRKDDALRWVSTARSALSHVDDPELAAKLANAEGNVLLTGGDANAARPLFERAMSLFVGIDPDHPNIGANLAMLGIVDLQRGDTDRAARELGEALERVERTLGAGHPDVATTLVNAALVDSARGNYIMAQDRLTRALAIQSQGAGAGHPYTAYTLLNLGVLLANRGQLPEAAAEYVAADAIIARTLGTAHPMIAQVRLAQAALAAREGDGARAVKVAREAIDRLGAGCPEPRPERSASRSRGELGQALATPFACGVTALGEATLAYALRVAGQAEEALGHARTSVELARAAFCADCPQVALPLREQGLAELALGRADAAIATLGEAERVLALRPVDPMVMVEIRFGLATALRDRDRAAAGLAARRALGSFPDGGDPALRGKIEKWLAETGGQSQ